MTREEHIKNLETIGYDGWTVTEEAYKSLQYAITVLKQEPILDKIKAEIEEEYDNCYICEWYEDYDFEENDISEYRSVGNVSDILAIIDKYKLESEVQDEDSN
jgi:hypothetical protein